MLFNSRHIPDIRNIAGLFEVHGNLSFCQYQNLQRNPVYSQELVSR